MIPKIINLLKNKYVIIAVIILILLSLFTGLIPLSIAGTLDTTTNQKEYGCAKGIEELIIPQGREGFICSFKENGKSESITIQGKIKSTCGIWSLSTTSVQKYAYVIELHDKFTGWFVASDSSYSSTAIVPNNPGVLGFSGNHYVGQDAIVRLQDYSFQVIGNQYDAIRCSLNIYADWNVNNPFDSGYEWVNEFQIDEAYLYEGLGGLFFDTDSEGLPINTYEIGETGRIKVETAYGGQTVGEENKPWTVIMRYPEDRGGGIFKEQDFGDMVKTWFTFDVTDDMFSKTSNNEYSITLYNTVLPNALILTRTIDLKANAPGDISFDGPIQVENGDPINIEMTATGNSNTQRPVEYFRMCVYYGSRDSSMPTSTWSDRWIIKPTDVYQNDGLTSSGTTYSYTLNVNNALIQSDYNGYITVWAVAYDDEGRGSEHSKKYTVKLYTEDGDGEVPEEIIDDETGEGYDYGGRNEPWIPWSPDGSWNDDVVDYTKLIIAIVIFIATLIIALVPGIPIPYGWMGRGMVIVIGLLIAIFYYTLF